MVGADLLAGIRKGAALNKIEVNDRSAPKVPGGSSNIRGGDVNVSKPNPAPNALKKPGPLPPPSPSSNKVQPPSDLLSSIKNASALKKSSNQNQSISSPVSPKPQPNAFKKTGPTPPPPPSNKVQPPSDLLSSIRNKSALKKPGSNEHSGSKPITSSQKLPVPSKKQGPPTIPSDANRNQFLQKKNTNTVSIIPKHESRKSPPVETNKLKKSPFITAQTLPAANTKRHSPESLAKKLQRNSGNKSQEVNKNRVSPTEPSNKLLLNKTSKSSKTMVQPVVSKTLKSHNSKVRPQFKELPGVTFPPVSVQPKSYSNIGTTRSWKFK